MEIKTSSFWLIVSLHLISLQNANNASNSTNSTQITQLLLQFLREIIQFLYKVPKLYVEFVVVLAQFSMWCHLCCELPIWFVLLVYQSVLKEESTYRTKMLDMLDVRMSKPEQWRRLWVHVYFYFKVDTFSLKKYGKFHWIFSTICIFLSLLVSDSSV